MKQIPRVLLLSFCLTGVLLTSACTTILVKTTGPQGLQEDPGVRTTGAAVEDRAIETKIIVNMRSREPAFDNGHFDVVSYNGVVLIVGQVESDRLKALATDIASEASSKIRRIHNELEVAGTTTLLSRANDSWITSKVRAQMIFDEGVPAPRVTVVTENGAVYLMGLLTQAEADRAANLARNVSGVTKVVKVFEHID